MKTILEKLACLTLALSLLLIASGAAASPIHSATITMPSSQWEATFKALLAYAEENGLPLADETYFAVAEYPALDGAVGYEHSLGLAGFMKVSYYDYGDDVFDTGVLTIHLDNGGAPVELALMALYFTILAGDTVTTEDEFNALMDAMCPIFGEVFSGEERVNGAQAATLRGAGYMIEVNDSERFIRLYTNVSLTQNAE